MKSTPARPVDSARFLAAYKQGWPRRAIDAMIRRSLAAKLFAVRVQGLEAIRATLQAEPAGTLFLANHSCWWDLYLVHLLNELVPIDGYGMMAHENLRKFPFFRRIGAFSVDRSSVAGIRASLDYAARLLASGPVGVWVFPQGTIAGNDVRPLGFEPGLRALIRAAGRVRVIPVAFRYEFWQAERPEAFVRFGPATWHVAADASEAVARSEAALTAELDALRRDVIDQRSQAFTILLQGKPSISTKAAGLFVRDREPSP